MSREIAIVGHGGVSNRVSELVSCLVKKEEKVEIVESKPTKPNNEFEYLSVNNYEKYVEFDEQKHVYDVFNKLANVRYTKPIFHKCKSCGFLVVDYQLDKNGVCIDCRKVDK